MRGKKIDMDLLIDILGKSSESLIYKSEGYAFDITVLFIVYMIQNLGEGYYNDYVTNKK